MKKSDFFKRNEEVSEPVQENKVIFESLEKREEETNRVYKKRTGIIDRTIIQYIIDNFPEMSVNIRQALTNLVDTLENTIDFIEDKSSSAIKNERDFELAESYRDKSKSIYEVVQNIDEYIDWMRTEYDKVVDKKEISSSENFSNNENTTGIKVFNYDVKNDDTNLVGKDNFDENK